MDSLATSEPQSACVIQTGWVRRLSIDGRSVTDHHDSEFLEPRDFGDVVHDEVKVATIPLEPRLTGQVKVGRASENQDADLWRFSLEYLGLGAELVLEGVVAGHNDLLRSTKELLLEPILAPRGIVVVIVVQQHPIRSVGCIGLLEGHVDDIWH